MKPRAADSGFTVLESIIAFVILVGVMTSMMDLVKGSLRVVGVAERIRVTTEAARSALSRVGHEIPLQEGEAAYRDGPVEVTIVITQVLSDELAALYAHALYVTVSAQHDDGGRPVALETIAIDPSEVL